MVRIHLSPAVSQQRTVPVVGFNGARPRFTLPITFPRIERAIELALSLELLLIRALHHVRNRRLHTGTTSNITRQFPT